MAHTSQQPTAPNNLPANHVDNHLSATVGVVGALLFIPRCLELIAVLGGAECVDMLL